MMASAISPVPILSHAFGIQMSRMMVAAFLVVASH